jgi:hypothetical protein
MDRKLTRRFRLLANEMMVCLMCSLNPFRGDFAKDTDRNSRVGKPVRKSELVAECLGSFFVFVEESSFSGPISGQSTSHDSKGKPRKDSSSFERETYPRSHNKILMQP